MPFDPESMKLFGYAWLLKVVVNWPCALTVNTLKHGREPDGARAGARGRRGGGGAAGRAACREEKAENRDRKSFHVLRRSFCDQKNFRVRLKPRNSEPGRPPAPVCANVDISLFEKLS